MKRVLINAANLHVGGGVQVAASLILELARLPEPPPWELVVYASSAVDCNLAASGFDRAAISNYSVVDIHGLEAMRKEVRDRLRGFDLVFTVFGPLYVPRQPANHLVGFAQAWIIYPDNEAARRLPLHRRLLARTAYLVKWWFFRAAEHLVVELPHVKEGLVLSRHYPAERIHVVNNCVSRLYFEEAWWDRVPALEGEPDGTVKLGYVARDYPHKNIDFLVPLARELKRRSPLSYRFFVTLSPTEWNRRSDEFRRVVSNAGELTVAQCPTFYARMDGAVFPSLLESCSATPLEAMAMRRPVFASDRKFVRECCGDFALYFDPLDPERAATCIDRWFRQTPDGERATLVEGAFQHVQSLPGSRERARSYLDIISRQLVP